MALDILRIVQIIWAVADVLLTGGAFALLGVYSSDQDRNCRTGGLFLWTLCGVAPFCLYLLGYLITACSRKLRSDHPGNLQALTMIAAVNNTVLGLLYQYRGAVCGSTPTKILLACFGAMPVWGKLMKQLVKAAAAGKPRDFKRDGHDPPARLPLHQQSKPGSAAQYVTSSTAQHGGPVGGLRGLYGSGGEADSTCYGITARF